MSDDKEAKKVNPFVEVKVKCPVCDTTSSQYYVKSKLYQPVEIEKDHHVLTYNWNYEEFSNIKPENFYVWHCPHCHFADENEVFRGKIDRLWKGKLELMSHKVIKAAKDPECFLVRIGKEIDYTEVPISNETAILTHTLACYIQEGFLSPNNRMPGKMAKFYLRLAWLYRERETLEKNIDNIPDGYMSLEEFIISLKEYWDEIPLSEADAMRKALIQYSIMLDNAGKEDNIKKEITLMFLLLNLNRRVKELDTAFSYVRSIFTQAMKTRQATKNTLDKGIQSGKLTSQQIDQMKGMITWLSNVIEDASSEGDAINEDIFWEEYEQARELAVAAVPMTPKNVMNILHEAELHEITCRKVATLCKPANGAKEATYIPTLEELKEQTEMSKKPQPAEGEEPETTEPEDTDQES